MSSLRCSDCGSQWPQHQDYNPCPECNGAVWHCSDPSMDKAEAHTRMTHARFEAWLDANNRRGPVEVLERIPVKEESA